MTGHRKSYRKKNHDYSSPGFYFITLSVRDRAPIFGRLFFNIVKLSDYGRVARSCLLSLEESFSFIKLDEYIIMPDHIHMIIQILADNPTELRKDIYYDMERYRRKDLINQVLTTMSDQTPRDILTTDKTESTPDIDDVTEASPTKDKSWILMTKPEMHLGKVIRHYKAKVSFLIHKEGLKQFQWVSRYYDHIIRTDKSLYFIRKYIQENPLRHQDKKAA